MPSTDFSTWRRAQDCIAQGTLTNSKNPHSHVLGVYPTHVIKGRGAILEDVDGKTYLDYITGLGVALLGYAHPKVLAAVQMAAKDGFSHSLPTTYEIQAAEALKSLFTFVDLFKFLKSGSEACSAAIKIARAYTDRDLVLSDGYHGWHDPFVSLTEPALGVPEHSFIRPLSEWNGDFDGVAAVIVEPVINDYTKERIRYLQELREKCTKAGALLIFDEVITGFRFDKYSVSRAINIAPDLIVIGKSMANGLPLAAVGGKKEVMNGEYFVSSTYAGEILSLVACKETVSVLKKSNHEDFILSGSDFITSFNKISDLVKIRGYPTRGVFEGSPQAKALFFQEMCKAGFLFCNSWFYSYPLMEYKDFTIDAATDVLMRMKNGELILEGEMPRTPFAQKVRNG